MSSRYPNGDSFPPPGTRSSQLSVGFEGFTDIDVNDYLEDDGFGVNSFGQELMRNQYSGSIQQPLVTNPSMDFGSNSFPVLNSLPVYDPMPNQTSSTAFGGSSSFPNNFPPQGSLSGQLLSDQPSNNNHGYEESSYFPDSFSAQNPLPGQHPLLDQPSTANLESSFPVQNFPGGYPLPDQPSTATLESSFSVQNSFPGHHPLPNQSSVANLGNSYCRLDSFSTQNSFLSGQLPPPNQPSTANVETSFSVQNSLSGHHPLPDQSSAANVGNSCGLDSLSVQNSLSGQHPRPNQPLVANVGSSYCSDSSSAQDSLPRQLSLPNQLSTSNAGNFFSVQNSLSGVYNPLPNQSSAANLGNSHCPNIISVQNSLREQHPRPNQPLMANRFSGQNSLPGHLQLNQPSNYAHSGNSYYRFSLPAQIRPNRQSVIANIRSFVPNRFLEQIFPNIANVGNSFLNRFPAVQNTLPEQNLPNQTSTASIRSSGANNASTVHNLPNQTSIASIRSSRASNSSTVQNLPNQTSTANISSETKIFSAVENLPNQTATANIRSSGANNISAAENLSIHASAANIRGSWVSNLSAAQNLSPGRGRARGRGRGRGRGRPPGNRNSMGRGRNNSGEDNFQLLNFSRALNHSLSNRTTLSTNIRSSNQNVCIENILWIQQQQRNPQNSGANTGNSSNLNHNQPAENILQGLENPNNFSGLVSSQISGGNNIQPNNLFVGSNIFPVSVVSGHVDLPSGQITGAGNHYIQDDLASNFNPLPPELLVVPPAADNNQTSGDQNNSALQENTPVQIVQRGNHHHHNNNNNKDNLGVDREGPELPPIEERNSAGKPEESENDPPLAQGLSWLYEVKKPVKNRGNLDENCTPSVKRFCKSTREGLFRFKKCPGDTSGDKNYPTAGEINGSEKNSGGLTIGAPDKGKAGETNGSEKNFGGLTSGADHDNGKEFETLQGKFSSRIHSVPNDQGTTDGSTISPPPPELVVNSSVKAEAERQMVDTVTTETAVLPSASSSTDVDNNVNSVALSAEGMEMETDDCVVAADAALEPDEKWSEEFDIMIGM